MAGAATAHDPGQYARPRRCHHEAKSKSRFPGAAAVMAAPTLRCSHEPGVCMFPEYRDLITRLKTEDAHFTRLFDEHNELDQRIKNLEARIELATDAEIETLKKEKLNLKDQLYVILKDAAAA
jgi:uncharacterized protein YdcH (DUF465 family)